MICNPFVFSCFFRFLRLYLDFHVFRMTWVKLKLLCFICIVDKTKVLLGDCLLFVETNLIRFLHYELLLSFFIIILLLRLGLRTDQWYPLLTFTLSEVIVSMITSAGQSVPNRFLWILSASLPFRRVNLLIFIIMLLLDELRHLDCNLLLLFIQSILSSLVMWRVDADVGVGLSFGLLVNVGWGVRMRVVAKVLVQVGAVWGVSCQHSGRS